MKIQRAFGGDGGHWEERALDALMDFGPYLPMTLTQGSSSAFVRVIGLILLFVFVVPTMVIAGILILILLFIHIFADVIRGD